MALFIQNTKSELGCTSESTFSVRLCAIITAIEHRRDWIITRNLPSPVREAFESTNKVNTPDVKRRGHTAKLPWFEKRETELVTVTETCAHQAGKFKGKNLNLETHLRKKACFKRTNNDHKHEELLSKVQTVFVDNWFFKLWLMLFELNALSLVSELNVMFIIFKRSLVLNSKFVFVIVTRICSGSFKRYFRFILTKFLEVSKNVMLETATCC